MAGEESGVLRGSGERMVFRPSGSTFTLIEHFDRNGYNLNPASSASLTVTRTSGRVDLITDFASREVDYTWGTSTLTGVEYPDGSGSY